MSGDERDRSDIRHAERAGGGRGAGDPTGAAGPSPGDGTDPGSAATERRSRDTTGDGAAPTARGRVVLRARDITKTYYEGEVATPVLKGVELAIEAGEFVGLMGPSGSGKSTLLSILGTLLKPTSGEVEIVGRRVDHLSEREVTEYRNRHIGFVFQFHYLLPDFTAMENVLFPSFPRRGRATPDEERRAAALLDRVGLADRLDFRPAQLSGGQRQRVAVARAIMNEPEVVLADEPTGNLDIETSDRVLALMHRMSDEEGTAFLVSTHEPRIAGTCDRVVHIVDGRVRPGESGSGEAGRAIA